MHGITHLAAAILKLQALEGFFSFLQIQQQILVNNKITRSRPVVKASEVP